jgi:hypothetical protein
MQENMITVDNRKVYGYVKYDKLCIYEQCDHHLREHLINGYSCDLPNRYLHELAEGELYLTTVFYNNFGKVDIPSKFAFHIKEAFNLNCKIQVFKNPWKKIKQTNINIFKK